MSPELSDGNGRMDRARPWIAPALLFALACVQVYRATELDQSPWKGGGFGMFSTVDAPWARFYRCVLRTTEGDFRVPLPRTPTWLGDDLERARTAPTSEGLRAIALRLAERRWVAAPGTSRGSGGADGRVPGPGAARALELDEPMPPGWRSLAVRAVDLELWRYAFDREQLRLIASRLGRAEVSPGES